ncbi:facilitated trehalose transporter Tret1-2 homolog [Nasonia vitripennis]|uniref:Major facilitator superfamily (MFS) profile domain-containing protein n=1 Tax=Nasonia vitripennis TaxID=7425 RepID=A0A7M7Q9X4_NASVI|nr:facilitated trehalose transporter Tret1-2 homolog [Nasonia vitripennis]
MDVSAAVYIVACIMVGMLFLWLPESPHWLIKIKDYERARRSVGWYQPSNDPDQEVNVIKNFVASTSCESFRDKLRRFESAPIRRAMLLIIILFTFMQITGLNTIIFYMETIIRNSQQTLLEPSVAVICVHSSGILATALSMCLIDRCGRRFLLIVSSAGVALSMAGLGGNSYLINIGADLTRLHWLPLVSVFLFIISYFVGLMSVPSTVLGEIFPADIKCVAGCVASLVGAVWSFAATRSFQPIKDAIGDTYVFWLHGICALLLIPYVCVFMPETKGKSLQEIQNKLLRK